MIRFVKRQDKLRGYLIIVADTVDRYDIKAASISIRQGSTLYTVGYLITRGSRYGVTMINGQGHQAVCRNVLGPPEALNIAALDCAWFTTPRQALLNAGIIDEESYELY